MRMRGVRYWWAGLGLLVLSLLYIGPVAASFRMPALPARTSSPLPNFPFLSLRSPNFRSRSSTRRRRSPHCLVQRRRKPARPSTRPAPQFGIAFPSCPTRIRSARQRPRRRRRSRSIRSQMFRSSMTPSGRPSISPPRHPRPRQPSPRRTRPHRRPVQQQPPHRRPTRRRQLIPPTTVPAAGAARSAGSRSQTTRARARRPSIRRHRHRRRRSRRRPAMPARLIQAASRPRPPAHPM